MLNDSIIKIRVDLQNAKLKKSGKNRYAGFEYFELADFLPKLNELMKDENINDRFSIENDEAILELKKGEEVQTYKMPFIMFDTPTNKNGQPSMQDIQYLGALNTYYKRYLYLNAFGITDGEVIDSLDNEELTKSEKKDDKGTEAKLDALATERQLNLLKQIYTGDNLTKVLNKYGLKDLTEMPFKLASELISKNIKK